MSDTYQGRVRIFDPTGLLVDVGKAMLTKTDPETGGTWGGVIRVYVGAALAGKTMEALLDLGSDARPRALVGPKIGDVVDGELVELRVIGLTDDVPF